MKTLAVFLAVITIAYGAPSWGHVGHVAAVVAPGHIGLGHGGWGGHGAIISPAVAVGGAHAGWHGGWHGAHWDGDDGHWDGDDGQWHGDWHGDDGQWHGDWHGDDGQWHGDGAWHGHGWHGHW